MTEPDRLTPHDTEPDPELIDLAQRIRTEREHLKLSQAQVADVLGIPRPAVSTIETGQASREQRGTQEAR